MYVQMESIRLVSETTQSYQGHKFVMPLCSILGKVKAYPLSVDDDVLDLELQNHPPFEQGFDMAQRQAAGADSALLIQQQQPGQCSSSCHQLTYAGD